MENQNTHYVLAFDFGASSGRAILGALKDGKIEMKEIHRFSNDPVIVNGTMYWDTLRQFFEIKQGIVKAKKYGTIDSMGIDTWGVDFGLIDEHGALLENAVHNELKIRGYQIRVGKIGKAEIDFVATRKHADLTEEKLYIQVSASILDEHTRERELSPLLNARDLSAKRMVLTLDRFGLGKSDGVTVANAIDWMLGK